MGETNKIKVLHAITRLDRGGSSKACLLTTVGIDKRRFEVTLLSGPSADTPEDLVHEARSAGVRLITIPELVRDVHPLKDMRALFKIYALIKTERFGIIHTHSSKAGFIGRLAARMARTPILLYTPHGHIFYGYFNRLLTRIFIYMERFAAAFTDKIITLTERGKDEWVKFGIAPPGKFVAIHSGVRFANIIRSGTDCSKKREELGIHPNAKVIGTAGRFVPIKGITYLIQAGPGILRSHPEAIFLFIGDGPLRKELEREAHALGLGEKALFLGWKDEVTDFLRIMDIFVLPSLNEGMGAALVEAIALGKPAVATEVGGIPSVVLDHRTGLLIPPGDPRALAKAVIRLLDDESLARRLGEEGSIWVRENFSFESMIKKTEELYEDLLEEKRRTFA